MATERAPLPPGSVIGILGGGQLGRMLALAAARLGYRCHIFCPEMDAPASQVTNRSTVAAYEDTEALRRFAAAVDVATYEFENIPVAATETVQAMVPVRPAPAVLATCQDRLREKRFLAGIGVPTTAFCAVDGRKALPGCLARINPPAVLKTALFGYDGKGQVLITNDVDPDRAWERLMAHAPDGPAILEAQVDLVMELSVIVGRNQAGDIRTFDVVENVHENHVLRRTVVPAPIPAALAQTADQLARRIATAIDLVGVLAVEMFIGRNGALLVNELAPRPHNSGHWTLDAAETSQFEQCVRAITGLPLGPTERLADAVMENLLGDEAHGWLDLAATPGVRLHLYGKGEASPGRKMGHATRFTGSPHLRRTGSTDDGQPPG